MPNPYLLGYRANCRSSSTAKMTSTEHARSSVPPFISAFVHIDGDLDAKSRKAVVDKINKVHRVRWKGDTATVEGRLADLVELTKEPSVAYIEDGLSLRAPHPVSEPAPGEPDVDLRRVSTCSELHKDGEGVLVGIIDVQGFDFTHPDFLKPDGSTRREAIWDQGGTTRPAPKSNRADEGDFAYGSLIRKHHMDAAMCSGYQSLQKGACHGRV
jgi:hypothetical protein